MAVIEFTKMHGCGNDYVYIDSTRFPLSQEEKDKLIPALSDRHFGIGGDGVIFIGRGKVAEFEMEMYNMDGSRGEMCGNGMRCVGKYIYEHGLTDRTDPQVESFGRVYRLELTLGEDESGTTEDPGTSAGPGAQLSVGLAARKGRQVVAVRVNMGAPEFCPERIPASLPEGQTDPMHVTLQVAGRNWDMSFISMGNPHAAVFLPAGYDPAELPLPEIGPLFEHHKIFPNRVNTEFIRILERDRIRMRVWERGSGETLACGTGCCAAAVAAIKRRLVHSPVTVEIPGGEVVVDWNGGDTDPVFLSGPATEVMSGTVDTEAFLREYTGTSAWFDR